MDKGKLIYRNQSEKGLWYLLLLMGLVLDCSILSGGADGGILAFVIVTFILIIVPYKVIQQVNNTPGFFEHGVGYFKNNRYTHWTPYHQFIGFECFVERKAISSPDRHPTYGLIFHQSDGAFVEIKVNSVQKLKVIWNAILKENEHLKIRLTTNAPMNKVYQVTTNANEKLTLAPRVERKTYHPASELLLEVLKNG